jgi:flagellar protein FlaF
MSLQNYQIAQNTTEDPRRTEYRLFAQVTKALMDAISGSENDTAQAIHWNRRMWLALQADCSDEENVLNDQTRAGIISLAIWVDKHSRKVLRGEAKVEPLIEVNRSIMEGLAA